MASQKKPDFCPLGKFFRSKIRFRAHREEVLVGLHAVTTECLASRYSVEAVQAIALRVTC